MNQDQTLFVRIAHHGDVTQQIEVPDLRAAMMAIFESFKSAPHRKVLMTIEVSNQPMKSSLLNHAQQVELEIQRNAITDPDAIVFPPDVTHQECVDAWESSEGKLMFAYQRAENRMGVDPETLAQIKSNYESKFPRVAPHGPKWTSS